MPAALSTLLSRAGWLVAVLLIALGAAGLVTTLDHRPAGGARQELTSAADQALAGPLEAIVVDLDPLAEDFDRLGIQGRAALVALVAADNTALDASIDQGQALVDRIGAEATALRKRIAALPGVGPGASARISADLLARVSSVNQLLDSTNGVAAAWATLSTGSSSASHLVDLLTVHDTDTGQAVLEGSRGNYADAVVALDRSDAVLAQARALRDRLASTADVSTLSQWLDRNATIDLALRRLYTALVESNGTMTDEARRALATVTAAQSQLPPDTRALTVIMADIARAGLNQAVIRIEESRGKLAEAIAGLRAVPGASASPSPGQSTRPGGSGSPQPAATPDGSPQPGDTPDLTPPDA